MAQEYSNISHRMPCRHEAIPRPSESGGIHKIDQARLRGMVDTDGVMIMIDPVRMSQNRWSWLNLALEKSATAQRTFHNVEELNGAEVYRKLVRPLGIVAPSLTRKNALRVKIQSPVPSKDMANIMSVVEVYEENMLAYVKAGGVEPADDERKSQLMKILPAGTSMETLDKKGLKRKIL